MTHFRYAVAAVALTLAPLSARADDAADARAVVEKAIKAHGGQENLAKFKGSAVTFKGTFHGMGDGIPMSGTVTSFGADKQKVDIVVEAGGQKIPVVIVLAGDKGWTKAADQLTEMDKDKVAEAKEQAYAAWVATLAPLADKEKFKLSTTGEFDVGKKKAVGVKVSSKGHRDVDLYFDKETGLLVKTETRVKDDATGNEMTEEGFPSDYKDFQGTKQATKFTVNRDGKLYMEGEASDVQLLEKADEGTFAKP